MIVTFADCSNLHCPRDAAFKRGEITSMKLPKHDMLKDCNGLYWCSECKKRYELIQWGGQRNWPELKAGRYAIVPEWECWKVAIMLGNEEAIAAYYAEVFGNEE